VSAGPEAPLRIALLGYGRMGREVERVALEEGHEIALRLDIDDNRDGGGVTAESFAGIDVAIDFSQPEAVPVNIDKVSAIGTPMVVGTTGWSDRLDEMRALVEERDGALVYGANLSVGANLFFRLAAVAAELFDPFADYDPYVIEHHHRHKLDAPSGTALHVAGLLLARSSRKTRVQAGNPEAAIDPQSLHVASIRAGAAPGEHRVGFDSGADSVELVHTARSREGFARGAVLAAGWIVGKRGVFEFGEVLDAMLEHEPASGTPVSRGR
jgi:4-hydroxy-tetrahydrodipicolinate reductase